MMRNNSFFGKLYRYQQSENKKNRKEDYLTEIFAQCLRIDEGFRKKFLECLYIDDDVKSFDCQTQHSTHVGKPDVFLKIDNAYGVIVECKVGSKEGAGQLKKYAGLLSELDFIEKHLVFLTKNHEEVDEPEGVHFHKLRWHEVFEFTKGTTNALTKALAEYLISEKMSAVVLFDQSDLNSLNAYNETLGKVKDLIHVIRTIVLSNRTRRRIKQDFTESNQFGLTCKLNVGVLWIGVWQFEDHDEMQIGVSVREYLNSSKLESLKQIMASSHFESYIEDDFMEWHQSKNISAFFTDGVFETKSAIKFLNSCVDEIEELL